MPYSITTKDGITINNIPDDIPKDHPDLKARVAKIRGESGRAAPAAAQEQAAGADDPGKMMAALIGAGRTTDQILDGMKQLGLIKVGLDGKGFHINRDEPALAQLATEQADKAKLYKPLQEQHPIATAVGEALPAAVVPVGGGASVAANVGRLALAGAAPGALEYGSAGERAARAGFGAAAGVTGGVAVPAAGRFVAKAVPAIGRTAKAIAEPLYAGGREAIAGRTLNRAAGEGAEEVIAKLANAAELLPGSAPTVAQVAENGGLAALERATAAARPAEFAERGMEQAAARVGALRGIAGDDVARAAAVEARKAATGDLYSQATAANYKVDPRLDRLLQTPAMQQALSRAKTLAENNQRPFAFDVAGSNVLGSVGNQTSTASRQITGQGLQDLKMAMDQMLTDPASGYAGAAGNAVKELRGQLLNWMEGANPAFKTARTKYAEMSKPIGQMDIGKELLTKLEPALNDYGALARETASKYATGLRNADQTARAATGFKGSGMADVMEPGQMQVFEGIAKDLARKANASELGKGPGSDTFQKMAMSNIAEQSGAPGVVGGALNMPGVSKVAKFLYSEPEEKIQTLIAQSLLNPQNAAQLMQKQVKAAAPKSYSDVLFANPTRATQLLGGGAALSAGNLFAQ